MPVSPTSSTPQSAPSAVPANPKGDIGSQDTFMKLLVAELKHQDPMDPLQSRDMVAQLAQLSSVQKLTTIDEKLGGLKQQSAEGSSLESANLIGKNVTAKTNRLTLTALNSPVGSYQLKTAADTVSVKVVDSAGQAVWSRDLGSLAAGPHTFQWDGRDASGRRVQNGSYSFQVTATDAQGLPVVSTNEVKGTVREINYTNGTPELVVGDARVALSDVTGVAQ